jgi:hypothetical protein
VVGSGNKGFSPDGTPALEASLNGLDDVLVGRDGALYFMALAQEESRSLLRRVREGKLETVAGGGPRGGPPAGPTPNSIVMGPGYHWLAEGGDGSLYIASQGDGSLVRRIAPTGQVTVVAGGGNSAEPAEEDASRVCLNGVSGLAIDAQGNLLVTESGGFTFCNGARGAGVRVVTPDGKFGTLAGTLVSGGDFLKTPR